MWIVKFFVSNKAQILYAVLVLLFNIVAIYYLFFFSSTKINLASFLPNPTVLTQAITKPITEVFKKFVFTYQNPKKASPKGDPTIVPTQAIATPTVKENDLIDCIGPDSKHVWLTQKDCDYFISSWQATASAQTASPSAQNN